MREAVKVVINPAFLPGTTPVDFQAMPATTFRDLFKQATDYKEVRSFGGATEWHVSGVFAVRDKADSNQVATRLALVSDDKTWAFVDLTPVACLALAQHLIEFAIASSNVNGAPQDGADGVLRLFEKFLSTEAFRAIVNVITAASAEIVAAKLLSQ